MDNQEPESKNPKNVKDKKRGISWGTRITAAIALLGCAYMVSADNQVKAINNEPQTRWSDQLSLGTGEAREGMSREEDKVLIVDVFNLQIPQEAPEIFKKLAEMYGKHGEMVTRAAEDTAGWEGYKEEKLETRSLADAVQIEEIEPDKLGNPRVAVEIFSDQVEDIIRESEARVVSLSWQFGKHEITLIQNVERPKYPEMGRELPQERSGRYYTFDGKEIGLDEYQRLKAKAVEKIIVELLKNEQYLKHKDGYAGENTEDNLRMMAELAGKFPEKTFVAAGGNPGDDGTIPDIREARRKLEEEGSWPKNLVIVGVAYPWAGLGMYGADVYVPGDEYRSSSEATTSVAEWVRLQGGIKEVMEILTEEETWSAGDEEIKVRVLRRG